MLFKSRIQVELRIVVITATKSTKANAVTVNETHITALHTGFMRACVQLVGTLTFAYIQYVQRSSIALNEPKEVPVGTVEAASVVTASFRVEESSAVVSPLSVGLLTETTL